MKYRGGEYRAVEYMYTTLHFNTVLTGRSTGERGWVPEGRTVGDGLTQYPVRTVTSSSTDSGSSSSSSSSSRSDSGSGSKPTKTTAGVQ